MSWWRTTLLSLPFSSLVRASRSARLRAVGRGRTRQALFLVVGAALGWGLSGGRALADEAAGAVVSDPSLPAQTAAVPPPAAPPPAPAPPPVRNEPPASAPGGLLVEPTEAATAEEPPLPVARPRFSIAAAIGVSVDSAGIADGRNVGIPSFSVQGGIGQDLIGFEARLFASEAAGQFSTPSQVATDNKALIADVGADRQAVDLMLAVRPFARWQQKRLDWPARFVRGLTADVGIAGERVSIGAQTVRRVGAVVAAYADVPVTPADDSSVLSLRLAVRRMVGTHPDVTEPSGTKPVGDTRAELLAGLAVVF